MQRRTRTNLMLLAMVLLLCAAAVAELKREEWHASRSVANLDAKSVQSINVGCAECTPRRFEKSQGRWWMRQPYDMPANTEAVQRLLAIAQAPVRKRHAATEFDAKKLGLAPPQATLDMGALHLAFGLTDAINGDRYVQLHDDVLLVPDRFSAWLFAPAETEIDRHFFAPSQAVKEVRLDGATRPDLAIAWVEAQATRVVDAKAAGEPRGQSHRIELVAADGSTLPLTLWRNGDEYLVRRQNPDLVYCFDEATTQKLLASKATP